MTGHANVKMISESIGIIFHAALCYYFVYIKDLGIAGTGYASTITNCITLTCLITYSFCIDDIKEAI